MSVDAKAGMARRPFLLGLLATAGITIAGLAAIEAPRLFKPRYAPTPYDDLFSLLPDREDAATLGAAWLAQQTDFSPTDAARLLRGRLAGKSIAAALDADCAAARMTEAHGWVLPETLVLLGALAAKAV